MLGFVSLLLHSGHGRKELQHTPWHWFEPVHLSGTLAVLAVVVWGVVLLRASWRRRPRNGAERPR